MLGWSVVSDLLALIPAGGDDDDDACSVHDEANANAASASFSAACMPSSSSCAKWGNCAGSSE